jgi:16S rRNA (cytidine1402-2'-O)-methyltransferase
MPGVGSPGRLFVVATPLGHLGDVSVRAIEVLGGVALVACEDTRRTAHLLAAHGIKVQTTSYFEHNERWKGERILAVLRDGRDVALVSDAGTPGVSDPGFRLVRDARAEGLPVIPVPGPSATLAALSVSGLPTDRFFFVGFLPPKAAARRRELETLAHIEATLVVFESPVRIVESLTDLADAWGNRQAFLAREMTKVHEEYLSGRLLELRDLLAARPSIKGEIVLVVAGAAPAETQPEESLDALYSRLVSEGRTRREAVKETAKRLGLPAREVYRRTLDRDAAR